MGKKSIEKELNRLRSGVNGAWDAVEEKGVVVSDKNIDDLGSYIRGIKGKNKSDGWTRPYDRPPAPEIAGDEQIIYLLFGVSEHSPNDYALRIITSQGQYRVEWGDGTVNDYNSNAVTEHIYDYTALDLPVGSEGYKWVWIKIYPITGNLDIVNFHQYRHSLRPPGSISNIFVPQVFEVYMRGNEITNLPNSSGFFTHFMLCNIFNFYGTHKIKDLYYFCYKYYNLKQMVMDLNYSTTLQYFMNYCFSYNQPFPEGVTFGNVTNEFMRYCYSYNQPFPEGVTFENATSGFMQSCHSYNQPFPASVTFENATSYFMVACYTYNQPFPEGVTFGNVTAQFMNSCYSFNKSLVVHLQNTTAIGTSFIGSNCFALKSLRLLNMGDIHTALSIGNSNLDVPALIALFEDLYDRTETTSGTITITKTYGASRLTPEQRSIATSKNWTIVG